MNVLFIILRHLISVLFVILAGFSLAGRQFVIAQYRVITEE